MNVSRYLCEASIAAAQHIGQIRLTRKGLLCRNAHSMRKRQPVTGHPQMTQTTAANISWDVRCLKMHAAAQVTMYIAKLLGKRLVADVNIPQEKMSSTRSLLLMDTPA